MRLSIYAALMPLAAVFAAKNNHCPPLGAVLPAPTALSKSSDVKAVAKAFSDALTTGLSSSFNETAISISIISTHEDTPMLDFHFTPPALDPRGAQKIDANTVYRIGSCSKLFTALATLKLKGVSMDDVVTKYLPQLRKLKKQQKVNNAITTVDWDTVTLRALASHMGGIPSDVATDLASFPQNWTQIGLPEATDVLGCVGLDGIPPCNNTEFWDNYGKRPPVYPPQRSPLYSNAAFTILSYVVEAVSGTSFESFVQHNILDPAQLTSTTYSKPADHLGAISVGDITWNATLGILDPAGGYYSSTHDMLSFATSILTHTQLPALQTNTWLQPLTFTSGAGMFLGAPWEIIRGSNVTSDQRLVSFYTKGGDVGTFHALLALVPDYDIAISVLTSGPQTSSSVAELLFSQTVTAMLPAVEEVGKEQAKVNFAGTYVDEKTNSTLTLAVDDEGPGMAISDWVVRGTDIPSHWLNYLSAISSSLPQITISMRLFPTGLEAGDQTAWRVAVDLGSPEEIAAADAQLFWPQASCLTWGLMDRAVYQFEPLDELVFTLDGDKAVTVDLLGFEATLTRS